MTANNLSFEEFCEEWLIDIREGNPSTTELGHRFAHKLLSQWLDIGDASDDLVYCDGAGDGGIDIAYLYRGDGSGGNESEPIEGHTWYLVQSKCGSAFRGTTTLLEEGSKVIETLDNKRQNLSSLAKGLVERLNGFRNRASELDRIILVFATEHPLTDDQKRILDDIRAMGRNRLGSLFDVESVSVATIYQRTLDSETQINRIKIPIQANLVSSGHDLLVGSVSLINLYDFLKVYRSQTEDLDQLYEKNVRRFLGNRGRINKAIQQTLQSTPERFGLYNNGITIVVEDFREEGEGTLELIEPYVVNGCQTTRTIWEVFHRKLETGGTGIDPDLDHWRKQASEGVVITKVVKVGYDGEPLLQAITRYTNSQNAVREKDFLALTSDFKTWAMQMANQYDVYLEIQRGGWDSQRALQKQNQHIRQFTHFANAFDLLKVYGAGWLREAGTAFGRNAAFLPNGTIFKRIMNNQESGTSFGVEDLYAAYKLQRIADEHQFGRQAKKNSRRQTRFLYYLVIIDLLRDVMTRAQMDSAPKNITRAFLKLLMENNETAARELSDTGIAVVDEYLTHGTDDSVFLEPSFQNTFNNDLNGYLKWEQLGKTGEASPRLRSLINAYGRQMGRSMGSSISPRELITKAIKS